MPSFVANDLVGLIAQLAYFAFVIAFGWMVLKMPLRIEEKIGWILLFGFLPVLGLFVFHTFRNSRFLLKHNRRKFNPRFNRNSV